MNGSFVKMKESELRIFYHDTDIDVPEHLVDVRDAARILEKVFDLTHQAQELLCAMFMDNTNRIVGIEKVHVGDVNRVSSSTHEIFKRCLLHNATRVLFIPPYSAARTHWRLFCVLSVSRSSSDARVLSVTPPHPSFPAIFLHNPLSVRHICVEFRQHENNKKSPRPIRKKYFFFAGMVSFVSGMGAGKGNRANNGRNIENMQNSCLFWGCL